MEGNFQLKMKNELEDLSSIFFSRFLQFLQQIFF